MKTPRLSHLALLLALAPAAHAAYPTWTPLDEGSVMWPNVSFKVGTDNRSLKCRYNECKGKGAAINLYILTEVPGPKVPVKVTIYKMVPRAKYNPRYYTDGPYDKVPEYIDAFRKTYKSELSHFKLDNSGASPVVVQGTQKIPARNDINDAAFRSYDQMWVLQPAAMVADELRPGAVPPAVTPGKEPPARTPLVWWCNPLTGQKQGRGASRPGRTGWTRLASRSSVCVKTPVVAGTTPPVVAAALPIEDSEVRWLTKAQQKDLEAKLAAAPKTPADANIAAIKAIAAEFRALVSAQVRPEAAAPYAAAYALPPAEAPAKINEVLNAVKMWGGDVTAAVGWSGENLEVQLSAAEFAALEKKPDALTEYKAQRMIVDGKTGAGFDKAAYDPVRLHQVTVAARAAAGSVTDAPTTTPTAPAALVANLDAKELALLTPDELTKYLLQLKAANATPPNASAIAELSKLSAEYRALIASEGRKPYPPPKNADEFAKMKPWQKAQFCKPGSGAPAGPAGADPVPAADHAHGAAALPDLIALAEKLSAQGGGFPANPETWASDGCGRFRREQALVPVTPGRTPVTAAAVVPGTGPDSEIKAKDKSKWVTQDLMVSAAKGAMTGLLIGSLFGPFGLIAGPLLGAAIFYGVSKLTG